MILHSNTFYLALDTCILWGSSKENGAMQLKDKLF